MNKLKIMTVPIMLVMLFYAGAVYARNGDRNCGEWMGGSISILPYNTDEKVIHGCDNGSFQELSHEYAKDKNYVYYKPMPNANNMAVRLIAADAKTFQVGANCSTAWDAQNIFIFGRIIARDSAEFEDLNLYKNSATKKCNMIFN
tara:strand:+ start:8431 stop:8865 length:435 start_codon:yes stop_codon:yes gene_type:complete